MLIVYWPWTMSISCTHSWYYKTVYSLWMLLIYYTGHEYSWILSTSCKHSWYNITVQCLWMLLIYWSWIFINIVHLLYTFMILQNALNAINILVMNIHKYCPSLVHIHDITKQFSLWMLSIYWSWIFMNVVHLLCRLMARHIHNIIKHDTIWKLNEYSWTFSVSCSHSWYYNMVDAIWMVYEYPWTFSMPCTHSWYYNIMNVYKT